MHFPERHAISRAYFFLERAEECDASAREAFESYLEAAIIFGRTAIHRLKTKYENHPRWEAWFSSLLTDPAITFLRLHRDFILKEGPPMIGQIIKMGGTTPGTRASELYYFEDVSTPATETVRQHLAIVASHVATAESQFEP
jgi:hypothetical protein